MPRQKRNSPKQRKTYRRRRAPKSRMNRPATSRTSPLAQVIGKGVRSLVSILPGNKVLEPIADFVLKAVGLSSDLEITDKVLRASVANTMLTAKFILTIGCLLRGTPFTFVSSDFSLGSRYSHFRAKSFTLTARPTNKMASRSGDWTMLLYPLTDQDAEISFASADIPPEGEISSAPYFKRCSALKPLTITYSPRVVDGRLNEYLDPTEKVCGVMIQYEQVNRSSYEAFTADEFAFDLDIVSHVEARLPVFGGGATQYKSISEKVHDCISSIKQYIKHERNIYHVYDHDYSSIPSGMLMVSRNYALQGSEHLDLDAMAI